MKRKWKCKDKIPQRQFFQKAKISWAGAYKNRIAQPGQLEEAQFSIKILEVNFGNSILNNTKRDKTSEGIAKKSISRTEWDYLAEVKR